MKLFTCPMEQFSIGGVPYHNYFDFTKGFEGCDSLVGPSC